MYFFKMCGIYKIFYLHSFSPEVGFLASSQKQLYPEDGCNSSKTRVLKI